MLLALCTDVLSCSLIGAWWCAEEKILALEKFLVEGRKKLESATDKAEQQASHLVQQDQGLKQAFSLLQQKEELYYRLT